MEGKQESWYLGWNSLYPDRCRDGDELYDLWIQHHILANIPMVRLSQLAAAAEWIVWGLSFHPHMLCSRSVTQSCLTLWDPMDCSPPGPSVHEISQARILVWVAIPFSRGSSKSRDQTWISFIADWFSTIWATRKALINFISVLVLAYLLGFTICIPFYLQITLYHFTYNKVDTWTRYY